MRGCRMDSSSLRTAGFPNARWRIHARSRLPSAAMLAVPKCFRSASIAAPSAAVSSREMASVSTTTAPRDAKCSAAADLPEPMPPVSPTQSGIDRPSEEKKIQILPRQRLAPEQRDQAGEDEVGAEWNGHVTAMARESDEPEADHRADKGREQDHQRQHLPAEPGSDCRQELEVAVAHAFLAGRKLVGPEHAPQGKVAARGANHRGAEVRERAAEIEQQSHPQ